MKLQLVTIAIILAGFAGTGANAQAAPSVRVSYADLDVASSAGMHTLDRRVALAADTVCGGRDSRDLAALGRYNACRKAAVAGAMEAFAKKHAPVYASR